MPAHSTHAELLLTRSFPKTATATAFFIAADPVKALGDLSVAPDPVAPAGTLLTTLATGKSGETCPSVVSAGKTAHTVLAVGVGPLAKLSPEEFRKAGASVYRWARKARVTDVAVILPVLDTVSAADLVEAVATGAILASFEFEMYVGTRRQKQAKEKRDVRLHLVTTSASDTGVKAAFERGRIVSHATNFARTVASRPGNDINPVTLAGVAKDLAKETGLKLTVIDDTQMRKLGMGGLLGVGGGSDSPPRLIALEHKPAGKAASKKTPKGPLLVVGKSITFDTGGISIKPAERMQKMIYDKCGGMAVLGLMKALAELNADVHVIGVLTAAENHVSGKSYRPGDILRMYNGVTVEITNTDAEGRLVLGDAIAWGIETYKPSAVVDLATLTGGCVVALGQTMAGLFSNNDALAASLTAAGHAAGEKMWRLPVGDDQRDMLKSELADVVNSAGRWASPLTGAAFVSLFVPTDGSVPWAHLDIAGVADTDKELGYSGKGATGYGVRTLVNWAIANLPQD